MKNNCYFLLIFFYYSIFASILFKANTVDKEVKILRAFTNDKSTNKVANPIGGMDYWETSKISKGQFIDWTAEFVEET